MPHPANASLSADDEAALRAIMERHGAAWNDHDMAALIADMAPDVEWINVVGMHWVGREQVCRAHEMLHRTMFAKSHVTQVSLELRALADDFAIGVSRTTMAGVGATPDGRPYPTVGSVMTLLFARADAEWCIVHGHNTQMDPQATAHDPSRDAAQ